MADCWSCGAPRGEGPSCGACGKLQPWARTASLFAVMELPARMALAAPELDKAFRELSRRYHPDRFGNASPIERRLALEHTARLNEAYRTLKDPQRRAEYLMSLEGVRVGHEEARTQDQTLLMELLELQETIDAARSEGELRGHKVELGARRDRLLAEVHAYFDAGRGEQGRTVRALDELRYLERLLQTIERRLEEMS
jgi:molecular chaperone HscB